MPGTVSISCGLNQAPPSIHPGNVQVTQDPEELGGQWVGLAAHLSSSQRARPQVLSPHSQSNQTGPCPAWASRPHRTSVAPAEESRGDQECGVTCSHPHSVHSWDPTTAFRPLDLDTKAAVQEKVACGHMGTAEKVGDSSACRSSPSQL